MLAKAQDLEKQQMEVKTTFPAREYFETLRFHHEEAHLISLPWLGIQPSERC